MVGARIGFRGLAQARVSGLLGGLNKGMEVKRGVRIKLVYQAA